jgi:hypothetical protein
MSQVQIARPSAASLYLQIRSNTKELASATGFLVEHDARLYLVTNRHVVRGRHNLTDEPLSLTGALPDSLTIFHHVAGALGQWIPIDEPLYKTDHERRWIEHPIHKGAVDLVAMELVKPDSVDVYPYDPFQRGPSVAVGVTDVVSIIGFPFGLTAGGKLAIWTQGSVATEPALDYGNLPSFLVDSRTRPGQSGSPVVAYRPPGPVISELGGMSMSVAPVEKFLGVYSGRVHPDSDLGVVWKASLVAEIIAASRSAC